jgi:acyl carrier protein
VTADELTEVVRAAVATALERDPGEVGADARLREDLAADSLTLLEVAVIVEERVGVRLADEDLDGLRTVADVVEALR